LKSHKEGPSLGVAVTER